MISSILLFFEIGGGEVLLILFFVLIFFGSKKIPELARGLGKGIREFKDASAGIKREIQKEADKIKSDINVQGIQQQVDTYKQDMLGDIQEPPKKPAQNDGTQS
jgi:sec-independent protein translocase protein TatA